MEIKAMLMDSLEFIDNYFRGAEAQDQKIKFEDRLLADKDFAEEVAFYLSTIQVARDQNDADRKKRFRELFDKDRPTVAISPVSRLRPYFLAAAAVLAALFFGLYLYQQPAEPSRLAGEYISKNLGKLSVQMGSGTSAMQTARVMYNDKNYSGSLQGFEQVMKEDSSRYDARELAGIAALQMQDYKKALRYFKAVADHEDLNENRGKFYQALTLMTRNQPGDKEQSKVLLQQVVKEEAYGSIVARQFLKKY